MKTLTINGRELRTTSETMAYEAVCGLAGVAAISRPRVTWRTASVPTIEAMALGLSGNYREGVLFSGHRVAIEDGMTFDCHPTGTL